MIAFIDDHREAYGALSVCRVPPDRPIDVFRVVAQRQDLMRLSARAQRDQALKPEIARAFAGNFAVYGVCKVWRQMMREMSLAGVMRGKPVRTTVSDKAAPCPPDYVNRRFYAPA